MRAKFGRGPTVVSKKGSLKFISRSGKTFLSHYLKYGAYCKAYMYCIVDVNLSVSMPSNKMAAILF